MYGVSSGQGLPDGFRPGQYLLLEWTGIVFDQDGLTNSKEMAVMVQLKDVNGNIVCAATTGDLFQAAVDSFLECKRKWAAGEQPKNPFDYGKNSPVSDPGLN